MKTVFTLFLVFVASLLLTLGMFVRGILSTVVSPTYLAEHVVTESIVGQGLTIVKEQLESDVLKKNENLSSLATTKQYQELVETLFDTPWVTRSVKGLFFDFNTFLHSDEKLRLIVDVSEKKESIRAILDRQLRNSFATMPVCGSDMKSDTKKDQSCRPRTMSYEDYLKNLSVGGKSVDATINDLPNTIDLLDLGTLKTSITGEKSETPASENGINDTLTRVREVYGYVLLVVPVLFGLAFLCVLGIVLIHRKAIRSLLAWISGVMIFTGVLSLSVTSVVSQLVPNLFEQIIKDHQGLPAAIPSLLQEVVGELLHDAVFTMQIIAGLITALGVCLVIIVCVERPKKAGPTIIRH